MDTWNERSKADVAADREADAFQAGQLGTGHFAKTFLEQQAYDRGAASRGGGGGAPISPIALPFLAMMAVGFWPLCGALTLGSGVGTFVLMSLVLQRQSAGVAFLVALAAAVAGLVAGWKIEQRLAVSSTYRKLRHVVRLAWLGALFTWFALIASFGGVYNVWPQRITLEWIDSKLSPGAYVAIFVCVVLAHFVSRAFDDRIEGRVDPAGLERRKVSRAQRWRRMKIVFVGAGLIGAVSAAIYGDAAAGIVGAFIAFGVVAMVLYWAGSRALALFRP